MRIAKRAQRRGNFAEDIGRGQIQIIERRPGQASGVITQKAKVGQVFEPCLEVQRKATQSVGEPFAPAGDRNVQIRACRKTPARQFRWQIGARVIAFDPVPIKAQIKGRNQLTARKIGKRPAQSRKAFRSDRATRGDIEPCIELRWQGCIKCKLPCPCRRDKIARVELLVEPCLLLAHAAVECGGQAEGIDRRIDRTRQGKCVRGHDLFDRAVCAEGPEHAIGRRIILRPIGKQDRVQPLEAARVAALVIGVGCHRRPAVLKRLGPADIGLKAAAVGDERAERGLIGIACDIAGRIVRLDNIALILGQERAVIGLQIDVDPRAVFDLKKAKLLFAGVIATARGAFELEFYLCVAVIVLEDQVDNPAVGRKAETLGDFFGKDFGLGEGFGRILEQLAKRAGANAVHKDDRPTTAAPAR